MAAVQALAPAAAAYPSPATSLSTPMTAASWGAGALHQRLNAFVKKSLIQQLVPNGAVVCDLYCGRGVDTQNWAEAEIWKYVGVDLSSSALEEAKEQWEKHGKPFVARFCELNPCMVDLEKHLGEDRLSADIVTCLAHLQDCFASEDMVRQLLKNVASLLKPGGYFFGATPDSSTIWYKYQKAVEGAMKAGSLRANGQLPRVKTDLYSISFEDDRFNLYGSRYQLRFTDDTVPPQPQILVHFPSLIRLAEELGLEYVEIQNLTEFYEDYRVPFAETLQNSCGTLVDAKGNPVVDGKSRLSPIAQDVLSLYTTFIFKKPDPQQRLRALKRAASFVPISAPTPPLADVKKHKKSSPALPVGVSAVAPEDMPSKKRRLSASPAIATSNGSKLQETFPKQERTPSKPKPEPVAKTESGRSFATPESRGLPSLERVQKTESPSASKPRGPRSESPSASKAKAATGAPSPSTSKPPAASSSSSSGGQRTESPKPKALEGGPRIESPNLRIKAEEGLKSNLHGSSDPDTERPSSSGLCSESYQRSDTSEKRETERPASESAPIQEPVKRKRVSRWSSEYVPKKTALSAEQLPRVDPIPSEVQVDNQVRGFTGPVDGATQSQHDTRYNYNTVSRLRASYLRRSPLPRNGKDRHEENTVPRLAERESQVKEEGEIVPEPPVPKPSSPKRDRATELHYERRTAQRTHLSETATRSETRLEGGLAMLNNDNATQEKPDPRGDQLTTDARPEEGSIQETKATISEADTTTDQVKREPLTDEPGIEGSQISEPKNEAQTQTKDDLAVDVLMERASSRDDDAAATTCATGEGVANTDAATEPATKNNESAEPPQAKDSDVEFEKGSKLSRDSPLHSKAGSSQRREGLASQNNRSKRDFEPAWETKPQRYTLRRAASQNMGDGALEASSPWSNRGAGFPGKVNNREPQGRGPVFHPRIPYVAGFGVAPPRPPLRAADRGRVPVVVPPLQGGLPGLLGAAPSPVFGDRGIPGDRRFETMGPPEGSRGYSHSPNRGPRSIRGSLYNDRVPGRGPSDFPGEGSFSAASNGLGAPWDDHFQGDGRTRNR